ncbi:MAG: class I SAM-dependent methyltransferase, partial [Lacisediminimonas sp.]|nr:class I SAM-dependent methyltransferase [Lacisediminimonas sp.]
HAPFAFWLAESLQPASFVALGARGMTAHLSVCQAVQRLELDARCLAVDVIDGGSEIDDGRRRDPSDADADAQGRAWHDRHYSGFSQVRREPAQDSLRYFRRGEIDWLHIDSLAVLAGLQADWPAWHDKLSARAVITVHGTVLRQPSAAAGFLAGLQRRYPAIEFPHGQGLMLLCPGPQRMQAVDCLLREFADGRMRQPLRASFARLGQACAQACESAAHASDSAAGSRANSQQLQAIHQQLAQQRQATDEMQAALAQAQAALRDSQDRLQAAQQKASAEAARADRLDAACKAAQQGQKEAGNNAASAAAALAAHGQDATLIAALQAELKQAKDALQQQARRLDERFRELGTLTAMIEEKDRELTTLRAVPAGHGKAAPEVLSAAAQLQLVARSGLFDTDWYLATYPDVCGQRASALQHFMQHGAAEMRNPSASFDTTWYCRTYPDVLASGLNPLLHYIRHGRPQGRAARAEGKQEPVHG